MKSSLHLACYLVNYRLLLITLTLEFSITGITHFAQSDVLNKIMLIIMPTVCVLFAFYFCNFSNSCSTAHMPIKISFNKNKIIAILELRIDCTKRRFILDKNKTPVFVFLEEHDAVFCG